MCGLVPLGVPNVRAAAARLSPILAPTPLVAQRRGGGWLKLECLQETGAFKVRGALNALLLKACRGDGRHVIAASAGNHGAGVAWAARHLGLHAVVVVPRLAPEAKVRRISALGGEVVRSGETFDDSLGRAREIAAERGLFLVHAFDCPDVIAGQGTVALELLRHRPDAVLVPIGGGGLAAGMSLVLKAAGIRTVGVQVEGVDAMASFLRGGPVAIAPRVTVADGLRVRRAGLLTRRICRDNLDEVLIVSEADVRAAMAALLRDEGVVAEGAGAVAAAALRQMPPGRFVAVVTGGNVDLPAQEPAWPTPV